MTLTTIEHNGTHYPARETKEGLIASTDLHRVIWVDGKGYPDKEAQLTDECIYGFASMEELHLPERKLLSLFA